MWLHWSETDYNQMFWSVLVPQGTIIKTHSTSILHLIKIKLICCDVLILYSVSFSWEISLGSLTSHRLLYYSFCRDLFCTRFLGKGLFFFLCTWRLGEGYINVYLWRGNDLGMESIASVTSMKYQAQLFRLQQSFKPWQH